MHDPDSSYRLIRENARRLAEQSDRMREAASVRSAHSRSGLLAQFLRQMADRIDQAGPGE
jgi:hypothetical protein